MAKKTLKASTLEYPLPAVMISCGNKEESNIITVAWTGVINSEPPRVYISVRPERHSYKLIKESGEFVINLVPSALCEAMDRCGCTSGAKVDKFKENKLTREKAEQVSCPMIKESPVNIECRVFDVVSLGSHDMFLADVLNVHVDEALFDESGRIVLERLNLVSLVHGKYCAAQSRAVGKMGYSVMKLKTRKRLAAEHRMTSRKAGAEKKGSFRKENRTGKEGKK